jgi:copper chaperone CopZ
MQTDVRVDGANCSLCLNAVIDQLRSINGVNSVDSSITEGCVAIDHDLIESDLLDLIGTSLHGVGMASNEVVMTTITPTISAQHCTHHSARQPAPATPACQHQLETVTDAITRLRSDGFTNDFYATELAELACQGCRRTMDPRKVQVHQTVRFEGDTNPDDQDIVFAMSCSSGCKGIYSAAYGPSTPRNDTAVLQKLARPAPVPSRTGPSDV